MLGSGVDQVGDGCRALHPLGELGGGLPHEDEAAGGEENSGDGEQVIEEIGSAIQA